MLWGKPASRTTKKKGSAKIFSEKARKVAVFMIRGYKKTLSPLFVNSCRFYPSCSQYAEEAIQTYGVIQGTGRALWRILRCNPFSRGGYDPVVKEHQHKED